MQIRSNFDRLKSRIAHTQRLWKRTLFWTGTSIVIALIIAITFGQALIDLIMPLPNVVRTTSLLGFVAICSWIFFRFLITPLRKKISLAEVAIGIEQRNPQLEDRLVSAIQFGETISDDPLQNHILDRLVDQAEQKSEAIDFSSSVDRGRRNKRLALAISAIAIGWIVFAIFPIQTQTALKRIFLPWEKTDPILTTKLEISPKNARILRGQSVQISVDVSGKSAKNATIVYRKNGDDQPKEIQMLADLEIKNRFGYELFNIDRETNYHIIVNEAESEHFKIEVFDVPKIEEIEIAYDFPDYTKMRSIVQRGDGNIRAVVGTSATIRLKTNKPINSAQFQILDRSEPMKINDGKFLTHTLKITEDQKYRVKLLCVDGFENQIPIEYEITAIPDKKPEIAIKQPGRDIKATKLEEIPIVVEAKDDFGLTDVKLNFSISPDQISELEIEKISDDRKQISRDGTFYLEEFDLEAGDVISYFAIATDFAGQISTSEIYFIEIKPFNERIEEMQADSSDQQQNSPAVQMMMEMVELQKQIIRETWKQINQPSVDQNEIRKIAKKQKDLRGKVQRTVDQIGTIMQRGSVDPEMLMLLEQAIEKMANARDFLNAINPKSALPPEQSALELMVKAIQKLQKMLIRSQSQSQAQSQPQEELELELDELADQFDEDQQQRDQEMRDGLQNMLDQAREMQQQQRDLNDQAREMSRSDSPSPRQMKQNSQQQSQLSQRSQQLSEQAQQMSNGLGGRQQTQQRLDQASQSLQQSANLQKEASENLDRQNPQTTAAKGDLADQQIQEAIDQLEKIASQFTDQALADAMKKVDQMIDEQSEIRSETQQLAQQNRSDPLTNEDPQKASKLAQDQNQLRKELDRLQENLSDLQRELQRQNQNEAAQNVSQASRDLAENQTDQEMNDARRALQWQNFESAERDQQSVIDALDQAKNNLQQAKSNIAQTEEEQIEAALDQLDRMEDQLQDTQRELNSTDDQRRDQLAKQIDQMRERARSQGDQEYKDLWLGVLHGLQPSDGSRKSPFPNFDLAIDEIRKMKESLEKRLIAIQEKKQLTQVAKENVPPTYRSAVDQYYEKLAKEK